MANPRVEIEIAAKSAGFESQFAKLTAGARAAANDMKSSFGSIQGAVAALGVSLSVAGFAAFIKGAIDAADKLNDLSKATGVGATTLGGIGFAAQQAGTDLEGVAKAFGKLNLYIADAQAGNEKALDTFRKLGISIGELKTQRTEEIFAKVADAFASFEDDANKAAGANLLFGKTYQSVLPLLDEGGDSLRKNIGYYERYSGVTEDLVRASDQFNDALTKLQLINRAFANHLAAALLPSLQQLVDRMIEAKEKSTTFRDAASGMIEPLKVLAGWALRVGTTFAILGNQIGGAAAAAQAFFSGEFKSAADILKDVVAQTKASEESFKSTLKALQGGAGADTPEWLKDTRGGPGAVRTRRPTPLFGDAGGAAKSQVDEFARAIERVNKLAAEADLELAAMFSTQEITAAQKALAQLTSSDEWQKFTKPQQDALVARYKMIDAIQRETLEWKKKHEEQEKEIKLFEELQAQQQRAKDEFTGALGKYAEENAIIEKQIGLVGKDDLARQKLTETIEFERLKKQALLADDQEGLVILEEQFNKRIELIEKLAQATAHFAEVQRINTIFADAFSDAIVSIVDGTKSLSQAFKEMERSIVQSISRIAAQKLADAIFGVGPNSSGGPGELFAKLFSGGGGGSFGDIWKWILGLFGFGGGGGGGDILTGLQGFSAGGFPPVGRLSLVGERGPELIYPRAPVGIAPLNDPSYGGRSTVHITQTVNVLPGADTRSARQAAGLLRDATIRAIKDR